MAAEASWWRKLLRRPAGGKEASPQAAAAGAGEPSDDIEDPGAAISFGYRVIFFGLFVRALCWLLV
jgi:hypothetical protein